MIEPTNSLPQADAVALCSAFLAAHAQGGLPTVLLSRGDELLRRLDNDPPKDGAWGRFLIALGQSRSEVGDDDGASHCFLRALKDFPIHQDSEAAVLAGYNQGILQERRGRIPFAIAAYRASANAGLQGKLQLVAVLRSAVRTIELSFAESGELSKADAMLAKQSWRLWFSLTHDPALDAPLLADLQRQLCALLLPENPAYLAEIWRNWPEPEPCQDPPAFFVTLFAHAGAASARYLPDTSDAQSYALLQDAALRLR